MSPGDSATSLFGTTLVDPSGKSVDIKSALANKTSVGLYFSAHWCPPCRAFTPMLAERYRTVYRAKGMEIIFVSSDRDEHAFREYHGSMPWLALPFSARALKESLSAKFGVRGIPMLVILDGQSLSLVTVNGREEVMGDPSGSKYFGIKAVTFAGSGSPLGGGSSTTPVIKTDNIAVPIDRSKPVTSVQIRFPDGSKLNQEFNSAASCADVLGFVSKALGNVSGKRIKLSAGFPLTEISDMNATLVAAGIANSQVTVQLV